MRVTRRNQRGCNARHLDRTAQHTEAGGRHIDTSRSGENIYRSFCSSTKNLTLQEAELEYYRKTYSGMLEKRKASNIKNRHPDRNQGLTIEKLYHSTRYGPVETIFQLGKKGQSASPEMLRDIFGEYNRTIATLTKRHYRVLSYALHLDESTPHLHIRGIWDYKDKDGVRCIGQAEALRILGIDRPDPTRPADRHNNAQMTFDAMAREILLDICEAHGLAVEREALASQHHIDKGEYIVKQIQAKGTEAQRKTVEASVRLAKIEAELEAKQTELEAKQAELEDIERRADAIRHTGIGALLQDIDREAERKQRVHEREQAQLYDDDLLH